MDNNILCVFGLILDIIGGYLIYKFGLPPTNLGGGDTYITEDYDDQLEDLNTRFYTTFSKMGIHLVCLGFCLQMCYYLIPMILIHFVH